METALEQVWQLHVHSGWRPDLVLELQKSILEAILTSISDGPHGVLPQDTGQTASRDMSLSYLEIPCYSTIVYISHLQYLDIPSYCV